MWRAEYKDEFGRLGLGFTAKTKEGAAFALGMQMGRDPAKFSRPMDIYLNTPVLSIR